MFANGIINSVAGSTTKGVTNTKQVINNKGNIQNKLRDKDTILHNDNFSKTNFRVKGAIVYRGKDGNYYHRDTLHIGKSAELEVYDKLGKHIGVANPRTGLIDTTKKVKGRRINVK